MVQQVRVDFVINVGKPTDEHHQHLDLVCMYDRVSHLLTHFKLMPVSMYRFVMYISP